MRSAEIFCKDILAGVLTEDDHGQYTFQYNEDYILKYPDQFISFSFPVRKLPYVSNRLFPVFDGLIPEGWLLNIAVNTWKLSPNDRMGLLMACCRDCVGALSVKPIDENSKNTELG
jgi:serine/threonine-protein kinase HipA